jgi:protein FrlC
MKLSFNAWVYCSFPLWLPARSLDDVIDELAAAGYDGIEVGAAAPHAFPEFLDASRRAEIVARVERHGMGVSAICPALGGGPGYNPVSPEPAERAAAARYMADCIDLAADLHCERVIWLGGWRRYGQDHAEAWRNGVESVQQAAKHAEGRGVRLTVEPTPTDSNMLEQASDCLRLIADAGIDAGVMIDTFHVLHRQDELGDALRAAGDRLEYVHVADEGRDAPGTHRDFSSMVRELRAMGYEGWLAMEVGFNRREVDPGALARASAAHLRGVLETAGPVARA